ncbi:MAG: class I tRNA ligase family protein, partial [Phycisphaeraceae bacterium]
PKDPEKKMVTTYGVMSGLAQPTDEMPVARNTSNKFDNGRNFANKLWNAVRFALGNFEPGAEAPATGVKAKELSLADRWILSRLARTLRQARDSLSNYEFASYAEGMYDFFWRDLCDWYIEAIKPTVRENPAQRAVLAACIDASLRMMHPAMPFITEKLFHHFGATVPERGSVEGVSLAAAELLVTAAWPRVDGAWMDDELEGQFALVQRVVSGIRQVRTQHQVPPRQTVELSIKAPPAIAQKLHVHRELVETLSNVQGREIGPRVDRPGDAAAGVTGDIELYLHGLVDPETERNRLVKRQEEVERTIKTLTGRLGNENYVKKAPAKLVQESRDQLAAAERELESVKEQIAALG